MAVTALACFVFWGLAQNGKKTSSGSPAPALEQLKALYVAKKYDETVRMADSMLAVLDASAGRADWYALIRLKTMAQAQLDRAREAAVQLVPIVQAQTIDDSITAKLYGLMGFACLEADMVEQGAWYYERCLNGLLRHRCKSGVGLAYMNLGYALKQQGDYRAARQYYLGSLPLLRQGDKWTLSEVLINLGDISRYLFEFDAARDYYQQAAIEYPEKEGRLAHNLGWYYADQGRFREALDHFQESCRQAPCAADLARIMARCAEALGDTAEAVRQYRLALDSAGSARDSGIAQSYIGHYLLRQKRPDQALHTFQRALHALFPEVRPDAPADNPPATAGADFWCVDILHGKARAFRARFAHTGAIQDLHHALAAAKTAMAALDSLRGNMRNEISGQDAVDYAYGAYETGIRIALDLDRAEPGRAHAATAYEITEHAKSGVLKANLAEKDLRRSIALPDSLLWREKSALAAVALWEKAGDRDDSLLVAVRRLEKVRSDIDRQAPLLHKARKQIQNVPLAAIQDALQDDELLLQYFWGDSAVIVFAADKWQITTRNIPRNAALDQSIDSLRAALTQSHRTEDEFKAIAGPVYARFCAPSMAAASQARRLIIIPDGPLWALPFEALSQSDGRFLVEDHAISYHWSGALWLQARLQGQASFRSTEYGGFAPQYPGSGSRLAVMGENLVDLPEARKSVVVAGKAWGGRVWQGPVVTKHLFQQEAGRYGVLHLAMHGLLDPGDRTRTGLAFPASGDSTEILNTLEISQMDLSAQLAVLSACNTGSGAIFRGEGVMSLSRAFALAGCPAITANLWSVPSHETNRITSGFLSLLQGGKNKDEALRAAKLDYLEHAEPERRHPYFWAGQVLVGNEQALRRPISRGWFLLGGLIAAALLMLARWRLKPVCS